MSPRSTVVRLTSIRLASARAVDRESIGNLPKSVRGWWDRATAYMEYRSVSGSDATRRIFMSPTFLSVLVVRITAKQVRPMLKRENFPIAKIYVPVKRRASIRPEAVREIAESMLEIGKKRRSLFAATEIDLSSLRDFIGWRLAKLSARKQLSVFWYRVRVTRPRHLTMARQTPFARR